MKPAPLALALALLAGLAIGLFLGMTIAGRGAGALAPPPPARPPDRPDDLAGRPARGPGSTGRLARGENTGKVASTSGSGGPTGPPVGDDAETRPARARGPFDVDRALAAIANEEEGGLEAREALARLTSDPAALAEALARFRSETDPAKLAALAALLGRVRSPAVEALAVELARSGDSAHRVAALDMLDAFETPAAIPVAGEILAHERDPALLSAAIYALPEPEGVGLGEAAAVDRELVRLARGAPDRETRRRAVERLGVWAASPADEAVIVGALRDDREAAVRAAAAFALEQRRGGGPDALAALAAAVARRDEDPDVRENAWQALRRAGPLPPEIRAIYDAYAVEREGSAR